ncbi:MAG TPA: adenine phosphoribosyltransferase [Gemmatimonadales bacterium]
MNGPSPSADAATFVRDLVRDIPDFPTPGILFKDITPLLTDPAAFRLVCRALARPFAHEGVTRVASIESRGFLFGAPVALELGVGLVPVRKVGKLPFRTEQVQYTLEYGAAELEVHVDAWGPGDRVLVVDDVLATGGTADAVCSLVERMGAEVVGLAFVLELAALGGARRLAGRRYEILASY